MLPDRYLLLIRGLPGSGKSTAAARIAAAYGAAHLEADAWFVDDMGVYRFKKKGLPAAHRQCKEEAAASLGAGRNVIVANCTETLARAKQYASLARDAEVPVLVADAPAAWDVETCLQRNVHGVDAKAIRKKAARAVETPALVAKLSDRDFDARAVDLGTILSGADNAGPEPPRLPDRTLTDAEKVDDLWQRLLEGATVTHALDYAARKWPSSDTRRLMGEALARFRNSAAVDGEAIEGWALEAYRDLYREMRSIGDFANAKRSVDAIVDLSRKRAAASEPAPVPDYDASAEPEVTGIVVEEE